VGEQWRIDLHAPAHSVVYAISRHDKTDLGQAGFGRTDDNGLLTIRGTFDKTDVGQWLENWYAEGLYVGQLGFTVKAK
jgi:hypothetical protein